MKGWLKRPESQTTRESILEQFIKAGAIKREDADKINVQERPEVPALEVADIIRKLIEAEVSKEDAGRLTLAEVHRYYGGGMGLQDRAEVERVKSGLSLWELIELEQYKAGYGR